MAPRVTGVLPAPADSPTITIAPRHRPWRSPADQPAHARPALLGIAAFAALLFFWRIDQASFHGFYANAARSGAESWKAFVFGSFDPAGTITLDKLPGFVWPQALSARIFGFHAWSVALPQAVEGVLAVLVLYKAVRQWAGANAALLACGLFTLTPVIAGLFRTSVEDPAFTLLLICAAEAAQRAATTGRLRTLVLSGVWVGLAFQTKMLEAWAALPALALVYVLSAPAPLRRRLWHAAVAGVVAVAVSASWIALVTLTPAEDRPYVDGTTDNSAFSMVVGYNFLNRFSSVGMSASDTGSVQAVRGGGGGGGHAFGGHDAGGRDFGGQGFGGQSFGGTTAHGSGGAAGGSGWGGASGWGGGTHAGTGAGAGVAGTQGTSAQSLAARAAMLGSAGGGEGGWSKMFGSSIASQTGWLYPLAALSLVFGVAWRRGRPRTDRLRAGYLMWGTWLAVFFLAFSAGSVGGHSYYMGVIATPLAALSGAGLVAMERAYRIGGRRAAVLPLAVAATAGWAVYLTHPFPNFRPWAAPVAIAATAVAVALLAAGRVPRLARPRPAVVGVAVGLLAVVVTPAAWATSVLGTGSGGGMASMMGSVGPSARGGGFAGFADALRGTEGRHGGGRGFGGTGGGAGGRGGFGGLTGSTTLSASQQQLFSYVTAHGDGARYVLATSSWSTASPFILATGKEVLPMGGFTGSVPSPTLGQFQHLVATHQLRFVLLGGGMGGGGGGFGAAQSNPVQSWVRSACAVVPPSAYGVGAPTPQQGGGFDGSGRGGASEQLYRCGGAA